MTRLTRPLIAIDGELEPEAGGRPARVTLALRYAGAVRRAGGLPLVLPPLADQAFLDELLGEIDGLVLSGGDDFDTERLGLGPTHPGAKPVPAAKQDFDLELCRRALDARIPTLGICYGMQVLALGAGGGLHQHLPDDRPSARTHSGGVLHDVVAEPGTKLAALLGLDPVPVISRHHQAVSRVGGPWIVAARDDEGLVEAIERADLPYALGVQWHPELAVPGHPDGGPHARLFEALVEAARDRAGIGPVHAS